MSTILPNSSVAANNGLRTVLFDLDGTLADTAPDLAFALNAVLQEQDRALLPFDTIRPIVSHGATALIRLGFEIEPGTAAFESLRLRLLDIYRNHLARHTRLFPGIEELLGAIEQRGMNWGIVTNKPAWLTDPLLEQIGLSARAACVVSGDTVAERKPHPAPMLHACHLAGSDAHQCLYVGDAARDIEAGRRAGMKTLVALFGYIGEDEQPDSWGADGMIAHPAELLDWITAHD
ncbi:MAG: phosphoglycolate phosphatase [Gammaproteobacteria bacterium]|nr:phosphoglycolate phosphatase [Gammaproteobacteria bacterium]